MRMPFKLGLLLFILSLGGVSSNVPGLLAQGQPSLLEPSRSSKRPALRGVRPHQSRKARLNLSALDSAELTLNLFDNAERRARRTKVDRIARDRFVWHGRTDDDGFVTVSVVKGVATGTAFLDGRSFEITPDADGEYDVTELNAAAFPSDDPPLDSFEAFDLAPAASEPTSVATLAADGATEIDVMVLWTPAARAAVGGTQSAIESLIQAAVANANLTYTNSSVNARLRLVHTAEAAFTETASATTDIAALKGTTDGRFDSVHALRTQYAADIVTIIGTGYVANGTCGVGYLMQTPSTAFSTWAFSIVDQQCAVGNLSYTHEVGHNQGLHHDPANTGGNAGSYPYAYGYQDPGGAFRTIMAYGSSPRVPFFSSPSGNYQGRLTGTASQDNARALNATASVVSAFLGVTSALPPPPPPPPAPCAYTVSPASVSFPAQSATATLTVTAGSGCAWSSSSTVTWVSATGGTSGVGTATVVVAPNTGGARKTSVKVAGINVAVNQAAAPKGKGKR